MEFRGSPVTAAGFTWTLKHHSLEKPSASVHIVARATLWATTPHPWSAQMDEDEYQELSRPSRGHRLAVSPEFSETVAMCRATGTASAFYKILKLLVFVLKLEDVSHEQWGYPAKVSYHTQLSCDIMRHWSQGCPRCSSSCVTYMMYMTYAHLPVYFKRLLT